MGAGSALVLAIAACGSATPFVDPKEASLEVPGVLRAAYLEAGRARFSLMACRTSEQRQAIGALDSERERVEQTLRNRFAPATMAELKNESDREFMVIQVEQCAGAPGIERFRTATALLARTARGSN